MSKFRVASDPSINDTTGYNTTRTVSSLSSMSTPNDTFGARGLRRAQVSNQPKKVSTKALKSGKHIKTKLLNLQSSSKRSIIDDNHPNKSVPGFIIHKPVILDSYDYSPFTNYPSGVDLQHTDHLPPAIKESQIKAWESAERITNSVIFGEDEDDEEDEDGGDRFIEGIPGYTKAELAVVLEVYDALQAYDGPILHGMMANWDKEERSALFEAKKKYTIQSERMFQKSSSFVQRRQIQINQKKELLGRIFGYQNTLNQEYITNNSSYSTLDNSSNIQKTFHEDKEEIESLMEEDEAFHMALAETAEKRREDRTLKEEMKSFDYASFQKVVATKLDEIYNMGEYGDEELNGELQGFSMTYLRKCLREEGD